MVLGNRRRSLKEGIAGYHVTTNKGRWSGDAGWVVVISTVRRGFWRLGWLGLGGGRLRGCGRGRGAKENIQTDLCAR